MRKNRGVVRPWVTWQGHVSDLHTLPASPSPHPPPPTPDGKHSRCPMLLHNCQGHFIPCRMCYEFNRLDALVRPRPCSGGPGGHSRPRSLEEALEEARCSFLPDSHFHKQLQREDSFIILFTLSERQFLICKTGTITPFRFLLTLLESQIQR